MPTVCSFGGRAAAAWKGRHQSAAERELRRRGDRGLEALLPCGDDQCHDAAGEHRVQTRVGDLAGAEPGAERRQQLDVAAAHAAREKPRQEQRQPRDPPGGAEGRAVQARVERVHRAARQRGAKGQRIRDAELVFQVALVRFGNKIGMIREECEDRRLGLYLSNIIDAQISSLHRWRRAE